MSRFEEYNRLIYGETIGWLGRKRVVKELAPEEYQVLLSLLTHWKTRLRWSAADRLGKLGDSRAVEPLIKTLQDTHWLVRLHAAKALGCIGEPIAIEPLVGIMDDECPYVRWRIVTALAKLNSDRSIPVTEVLISALGDSDRNVRARAAWGLGGIASPSTVAAIAFAVRDPDTSVSWRAVDALQRIGVPATAALLRLLDCPDSEVRYRVIKALGKIGDQRAIKPLEGMLNDPSKKVQGRAMFALRQLGCRVAWRKLPSKDRKLPQWWQKLWGRG